MRPFADLADRLAEADWERRQAATESAISQRIALYAAEETERTAREAAVRAERKRRRIARRAHG